MGPDWYKKVRYTKLWGRVFWAEVMACTNERRAWLNQSEQGENRLMRCGRIQVLLMRQPGSLWALLTHFTSPLTCTRATPAYPQVSLEEWYFLLSWLFSVSDVPVCSTLSFLIHRSFMLKLCWPAFSLSPLPDLKLLENETCIGLTCQCLAYNKCSVNA